MEVRRLREHEMRALCATCAGHPHQAAAALLFVEPKTVRQTLNTVYGVLRAAGAIPPGRPRPKLFACRWLLRATGDLR